MANSIRQFGFLVPIVADGNGVVVAGHTRLLAAKRLGMETVPAIMADSLTDGQAKAFRLADNKTAELASWDWGKLDAELEALAEMDWGMERFGFDTDIFNARGDFQPFFDEAEEQAPVKKVKREKKDGVVCPHCGQRIKI